MPPIQRAESAANQNKNRLNVLINESYCIVNHWKAYQESELNRSEGQTQKNFNYIPIVVAHIQYLGIVVSEERISLRKRHERYG